MDRAGATSPLQLELPLRFRRQRMVAAPVRRAGRRRGAWAQIALELEKPAEQLRLDLVIVLTEAEIWAEQQPVHRIVAAAGLSPPVTRAARSVFDLAAGLGETTSDVTPDASPYPAEVRQVVRTGGTTRHVGCAYPSNRWTPEREEQERARRARQRPPKPVKGARTRSRKLSEMIGEG